MESGRVQLLLIGDIMVLVFALMSVFLFGNGYQAQKKYDHCKEKEFKGEYCSLQKKLSKFDKKGE